MAQGDHNQDVQAFMDVEKNSTACLAKSPGYRSQTGDRQWLPAARERYLTTRREGFLEDFLPRLVGGVGSGGSGVSSASNTMPCPFSRA